MSVRADAQFRRDIGEFYGPKAARYLSEMPLIYIPNEQWGGIYNYTMEAFKQEEGHESITHRMDYDRSGNRRCLIAELTPGVYKLGNEGGYYFTIFYEKNEDNHAWDFLCMDVFGMIDASEQKLPDGTSRQKIFQRICKRNGGYAILYALSVRFKLPKELIGAMFLDTAGISYARDAYFNPIFAIEDKITDRQTAYFAQGEGHEKLDTVFAQNLGRVCGLHLWIEDNPVYPVSQKKLTTNKRKKTLFKQKPHLDDSLTTIVYLNKLPSSGSGSAYGKGGTGTNASPKAHQRRGYHRTLRHKKYRNHPLYQVEGGIYVKPTFVGDPHTIVNNVEYRLLVDTKKGHPT